MEAFLSKLLIICNNVELTVLPFWAQQYRKRKSHARDCGAANGSNSLILLCHSILYSLAETGEQNNTPMVNLVIIYRTNSYINSTTVSVLLFVDLAQLHGASYYLKEERA